MFSLLSLCLLSCWPPALWTHYLGSNQNDLFNDLNLIILLNSSKTSNGPHETQSKTQNFVLLSTILLILVLSLSLTSFNMHQCFHSLANVHLKMFLSLLSRNLLDVSTAPPISLLRNYLFKVLSGLLYFNEQYYILFLYTN